MIWIKLKKKDIIEIFDDVNRSESERIKNLTEILLFSSMKKRKKKRKM